jgi:hypothetical protein
MSDDLRSHFAAAIAEGAKVGIVGRVTAPAGAPREHEEEMTLCDAEELRLLRAIRDACEPIYERLTTGNDDEVALSGLLEDYSVWRIG